MATATLWVSDWQSCLATVSVSPERRRELSAVSTEQRRQLLIFYLSIIFVFHREKASEQGKCVCVYASPYIFGADVFVCCPLAYDWGSVNAVSMCTLLLRCCCRSKSILGQQTHQSVYSLHCSLIGWKRQVEENISVCLYAVHLQCFLCASNLTIADTFPSVSYGEVKLLLQLCTFGINRV